MNPATAATLTTALVWTDMPDAMLVRAHQGQNNKSMVNNKSEKQSNIMLTR